jgi:hypothetical protein
VNWYSSEQFKPGQAYVDADGRFCLEYAGSMTASAARGLPGVPEQLVDSDEESERVLVFIVTHGQTTFYTHTKRDADLGYSFISLADRLGLTAVEAAPQLHHP